MAGVNLRPGRPRRLLLALLASVLLAASGAVALRPAASLGVARSLVGLPAQSPSSGYVPLVPARLVDTRVGQGGPVLGPGETRRVSVAGSPLAPAVPADARGVLLNVTVTEPSAAGYLTVWPAGRARPLASNLNFTPGQTVANAAFVGTGTGGGVEVFNFTGSSHLVVDVVGYVPGGARGFEPVQPARLADTRLGLAGGPLAPGEVRRVGIGGWGEVPIGATAVALTVTAVGSPSDGWLSVWPAGGPWPGSSTVNFPSGGTVANATIVGLGSGAAVDVLNGGSAPVDLVMDVSGWFTAPGGAGSFVPVAPRRIADTREGLGGGMPRVGESRRLVVAAKAGVPAGAAAVVLNVTADRAGGGGYLTLWPGGSGRPVASNLNFAPGPPVANLVVAGLGPDGTVSLFAGAGRSHVIVDVMGYVTGPPIPTPAGAGGLPGEEDWLGWFNHYRTGAGLPPVWADPALAVGGEAHGRYLVWNNRFGHEEDLTLAYATPEGDAAGRSGNLFGANCARLSPRRVVEGWFNSVGHALWMLNPKLRATSWAEYADLDSGSACGQAFELGWVAVLDVLRGRDAAAPVPPLLRFPGPAQTVAYRPTRIYVTFPSPVSGPASASVSANGQPVGISEVVAGTRQGDRASHTVAVSLAGPLPVGRVDVTVQAGGQSSSWSFTVAQG
jgi:hypothetical protein